MKPWFSRWRRYPFSVAGHIAQGVAAGTAAAYGHEFAAGVWFLSFWGYQFGSGLRKWANQGHCDTMGNDGFDFAVGFVPGYAITRIVLALLAGG